MNRPFALCFVLAALAAGCSNSETIPPPPPPPVDWTPPRVTQVDAGGKASDRERAAGEAYAAGIRSPGFAQLASSLQEDAHFASPVAKDAHGRDKVVQAHQDLFGAFDDRTFVVSRVWITDSAQALEWTMTGVQARDWMGVPATHKPVTFQGVTLLWTYDDGTINDVHVVFDPAVVKVQLGAGPKELAGLPPPTAPSGPRQERERAGAPEETQGLAVVRKAFDALENGDEAGYVGAMADDVEVKVGERAEPLRGASEARAYFKMVRKAISSLDVSIDNAWAFDGHVVVEYALTGEQRGALPGIPARRDRLIKLTLVDVIELRDGKIARVRRYDNPSQALAEP